MRDRSVVDSGKTVEKNSMVEQQQRHSTSMDVSSRRYSYGYGGAWGFISVLCVILPLTLLTNANVAAASATELPEKNWGSYYDPENIFCGKYDCYKILGFDFEEWGRSPPDKKDLTQSYRELSKKWHPDKNAGDKGANERFMKINKAYKVLTSKKRRTEYDYLRAHPMEYFNKYGNVMYSYAPKTDTMFVIFILLLAGSIFTWFAQKNKWQQIANLAVKHAVEGLKNGEGGSTESIKLRAHAEDMLKEKKEKEGLDISWGGGKTKGKMKLTKKEVRQRENEELRPIIEELVKDIKDFGAGFHQPTWKDILVVKMAKWPLTIAVQIGWHSKYFMRRLQGAELNDDEKEVLTKRAVGPRVWETAKEKDRNEMVEMKLWKMENLEEWSEMQDVKQLSSREQKAYGKLMKKKLKNKASKQE